MLRCKTFRFQKIGILLFFIVGCLSFVNFFFLPYARLNYKYSFCSFLITFLLFLLFYLKVNKKIDALPSKQAHSFCRVLIPIYCIFMLIIYLFMGYYMEYTPSGDNFMLYNASQVLAKQGHFDTGSDFILYFGRFSNQWGFLLFLTVFNKLLFSLGIHNLFYAHVLLQILLYELGFIALFSIARRINGIHGVLKALFFLFFCFPIYLAASVLYTDTFSLPFVLFSLYTSIRIIESKNLKNTLIWSCLCGFSTVIGGQIKMTVAIVFIASAIVWFLSFPFKKAVLSFSVSLAIFIVGSVCVHSFVLNRYLDKEIYKQEHTPIIHWIMMSIPDGDNPYGGVSSKDYALTWQMMDDGASHQEVMDSIYSRIKDKIYTLRFPNRLFLALSRKNAAAIGDGSFGMTEMLDDGPVRYNLISKVVLENGPAYPHYVALTSGIWGAVLLFSLISAWFKRNSFSSKDLLLYISCLGIFLFLMIWEARSRYLFNCIPLFLLAAGNFSSQHMEDLS